MLWAHPHHYPVSELLEHCSHSMSVVSLELHRLQEKGKKTIWQPRLALETEKLDRTSKKEERGVLTTVRERRIPGASGSQAPKDRITA
jgi:hypothetical protein